MIITRTVAGGFMGAGLCCLVFISVAPGAEVGAVPSVGDAIVRAVDVAARHHVFSLPRRSKDGAIRPNHFRRVEVLSEKERDGAVRVLFSLPDSSKIVAKGRMATTKILEVRFTGDKPNVKPFKSSVVDKDAISAERDARFSRAVAAVLRKRSESSRKKPTTAPDRIELAVSISERDNKELFVLIERIPYLPGGHTGYVVSAENKVLRRLPGR